MPAFTFNGFSVGSRVAVSAAQGANTASNTVTSWGQQNLGSLDILHLHSGQLVAPAAVWFEPINIAGFNVSAGAAPGEIYKPGYHDITYVWEFDDAGGFDPALNVLADWNDRNVAYGSHVAHVFDTPGTYRVQVTAIDSEHRTGTASVVINIQDPAIAYAGSRTILVDPTGAGDSAAYPGAQVFTTVSAAVAAFGNLGQTGRILLKRGETYTNVNVDISPSMVNFRMGAWGTGPKPVLRPVPISSAGANSTKEIFQFLNASPVADFVIHDLDMRGTWDADTESGDPREEPLYWLTHTGASSPFYCVHGCDFSGFAKVKFGNISHTGPLACVFNKVTITNWQDYGMFGHGPIFGSGNKRFAVIGSALRQSVHACQGPAGGAGGKDGFTNDHGPFRTSGWDKVYIDACSFYSSNGWSGGPAGRTAAQACIRVNTEGDIGAEWFISRVACEGGFVIVDADSASNTRPDSPWNFVIDKALLVGTPQTTNQIVLGSSGTTLRNIIGVMPDVAYESSITEFVTYLTDNPQNNVHNEPVRLHSCTFLNLDSADNMVPVSGDGIWNDYTQENIVFHAPNQPGSVTTQAPIDTTTPSGFSLVYPGKRISTDRSRITLSSTVASGGTVASVPYPSGTTQSDFSPVDNHAVLVGSDYYFTDRGAISVAFGASSITLTNLSGTTWGAGTQLTCNFKLVAHTTETASANPPSIPLPRPQGGSSAATAHGGMQAYDDATGRVQTQSPSQGALRPA